MPMRHEEQPEERYVSKPADEDDPDEGIAFWRDVDAAYVMCLRTIKQGKDFGDSRTGKEWTGIVERRLLWMRDDESKVIAKVEEGNKLYSPLIDRALVDFRQVCRKQEDKLRRLRADEIDYVSNKPSRASREYKGGTYDDYVQQALRRVYDKCREGRKEFEGAVEGAGKWRRNK